MASDSWAWTCGLHARETVDLAQSLLKIEINTQEIDPTEITKETTGTFDAVLYLGVFYHLIEPIFSTRRIAECAARLMIIETHIDALAIAQPAMIFYPGAELNNDPTNWWGPNPRLIFDLMTIWAFRVFSFAYIPSTASAGFSIASAPKLTRTVFLPSSSRSHGMI